MRKLPIDRVGEFLKAVLTELRQVGGSERLAVLLDRAEKHLQLSEYEKASFEKSGQVRWRHRVAMHGVGLEKGGWIEKSRGVWRLTEAGHRLAPQSPAEIVRAVDEAYARWDRARKG